MTLRRVPICNAVFALIAMAATFATNARAQGETVPQRDSTTRTTIGADLGYVSFDHDIEAWRTASIALSRRTSRGSLIGRVNLASRFGTTGAQLEVDAYPRWGKGRYFYLNAGVSESSIFPGQRFGAEVYTNLPNAWEASVGLRALWFDGSPVTLYTGTIGRYAGNYWVSLRPFVRSRPTGTSTSAGLTVRRYTSDADNYVGGRVSFGSSPADNITPDAVTRIGSSSFNLQGSHAFGRTLIGTWAAGHDSEDLDAGRSRNSWTISIGVAYRY